MKWSFVFIALMGCAANQPYYNGAVVSEKFTPHEVSEFQAALNDWRTATDDSRLNIPILKSAANHKSLLILYAVGPFSAQYRETAMRIGDFCGVGERRIAAIGIRTDCLKSEYTLNGSVGALFRHELGHIFGLHHIDDSIMSATEFLYPCIDSVALKAYCKIHHCGSNAHSTCD